MSQTLPPYLVSAREKAAAAAARVIAPPSPAVPAPPAPTAPPASTNPKPRKPAARAARSPQHLPTTGKGAGNHSTPANRTATGEDDFEGLADRIVAESGDAEAAAAVRPHLPDVLAAMVRGAKIPGSQGAADRSMLMRVIKHSSSTAREQNAAAKAIGNAVGDRLAAALARAAAAKGRVIDAEPEG